MSLRLRLTLLAIVTPMFLISLAIVVIQRVQLARADFGPALTLCPGPDLFGYTCTNGETYAYIDATNDTQLYALDGVVELALPFPFTFYGTTYTAVYASSNGNLQFDTQNVAYSNACLNPELAPAMGDLIAPYWDDLDLRLVGFLETAVVGEEPNRIFVIEWDGVPRYSESDTVTFEVQLFEGSNDIVFLYEDVTAEASHNGDGATIGLQSEAQGLSLQLGCNQAVIADAAQVAFPYPALPNPAVPGTGTAVLIPAVTQPGARSQTAALITQLTWRGPAALAQWQRHGLSQSPPLAATATEADVTGDGQTELILTQYSTARYPALTQLTVLGDIDTTPRLLLETYPATRLQPAFRLAVKSTADVTADGIADVTLHDDVSGAAFVLTAASGELALHALPHTCSGSVAVQQRDDGRMQVVRGGCGENGRLAYQWDGVAFTAVP